VASILGISNGEVISGQAKTFEDYFFKCIHMVLAFVVEQSAFRIMGVVDKSMSSIYKALYPSVVSVWVVLAFLDGLHQ
jgi:hypothetical protein